MTDYDEMTEDELEQSYELTFNQRYPDRSLLLRRVLKMTDELKATRAALKQTNDALSAYIAVAERTGALNVLPGPAWDTPNIKPPGRCEVLVLRPAIWRDDIEEWEDTRTDKYLSLVVACRPAPTVTPAALEEPTP